MNLKCPHCNAPTKLAEGELSKECPYCHSLIRAPADPAAPGPRSSGIGVVVMVLAGVLVCLGAGAGMFLFTAVKAPPPPPLAVSVPTSPPPQPAEPPPLPASPVKQVLTFGEAGTGAGQLDHPVQLAVAPDGAFFVAESGTGRVQKFDGAGKYVDVITLPPDKLTKQLGVFGMTMDVKGHLYVNRVGDVLVYDAATLKPVRTIAGSYPDVYFHGGLAADPTGHVFALTDRMGDIDLVTVDPSGKRTGKKRLDAKDIAVDGVGTKVLVGDDLVVLDAKGEVSSKVAGVNARALAIDGKGHVFVAKGSTVDVFDLKGTKLLTLPVRADDVALDAQHRLVTLAGGAVEVHEVDLGSAP